MSDTKPHSPKTWTQVKQGQYYAIVDAGGSAVAIGILYYADANLIITAVNSHKRLVEALETIALKTSCGESAKIAIAALAAVEVNNGR